MNNTKTPKPVKASRTLKPKPSLGILPAVISDQTSFPAIGLTGGQLREVVRKHGIPHRMVGMRMLVAVDDLLAFVRHDLTAVSPMQEEPTVAADQPDDVDAVLAVLGKRRTA